jgi:hypothetical protein
LKGDSGKGCLRRPGKELLLPMRTGKRGLAGLAACHMVSKRRRVGGIQEAIEIIQHLRLEGFTRVHAGFP